MKQVRLTKKLADQLNGVDVSRYGVGDVLDLKDHVAAMMIAEGWAQPLPEGPRKNPNPPKNE